ncbi:MAG: glycogen synthase GlgA [Clostridia bacterium]|nr:glycogen synthase GlgA [Clostridia bacterium]
MSNILFVGSEGVPFAKSGGLADVMGALPKAVLCEDFSVAVIMPLYKGIEKSYFEEFKFLGNINVSLAWRKQYAGLYRCVRDQIIYYFVDNKQYFERENLYGYYDDGERFAFFSKAVLQCLPLLDAFPDVLHCNDWETALLPVYLKTIFSQDPVYKKLRTVFTIHNIEYQGKFNINILEDIVGLPSQYQSILEFDGNVNYMKGAIVCCDKLTTVSPSYAEEITYPFYGHRLEIIIKENEYKLYGIKNGIDTEIFDPAKDPAVLYHYDIDSSEKKILNKLALQKQLNLDIREDIPLFAMVSRLADHKGLDLVMGIFDEFIKKDVQFIILGTGEVRYEDFFRRKALETPNKVASVMAFSGTLANQIYAGADIFLMPSISEPCGLSQMIALRYGTIPIIRQTGGLADSVFSFSPLTNQGNGITFATVNAHDMLWAINRGIEYYSNKPLWNQLMRNAFASENSWLKPAEKYKEIYGELVASVKSTTEGTKEWN